MNRNYNELIRQMNSRMNPEGITLNKSITESLQRIPQKGIFLYVKKAMLGVDPEYTRLSKEAGQKVREKLERELSEVSFEYQGSVMTNTHIRGYSDIDLLAISEKFYTFDRDGINSTLNNMQKVVNLDRSQVGRLQRAVQGGGYTRSLLDLRELRIDSEQILNRQYTYVDDTKPKSIKVSLTNPKREVDVVIAGWYKNADYYISDDKTQKGIKVFVKGKTQYEDSQLPPDYPFLSIARINTKDSGVNGRLKRMIRFLKTIKADSGRSDQIKLFSFDFNAICYDIDAHKYADKNYLDLVEVVVSQLAKLANNSAKRNALMSVDGRESIFRNRDGSENTEKVESLKLIIHEVNKLLEDILEETRNLKFAV